MATKKDDQEKRTANAEQMLRQVDAGAYLAELRGNTTMAKVAKDLGYSSSYIGYIEKGFRVPSDEFLSKAAAYYGVDLDSLFKKWGKIPILTKSEIRGSDTLQDTLLEIARNKKLSDEEKEELYDEIYQTYQRFLERKKIK